MSAPRAVEKGATYLVTRRCLQRLFMLLPTAETQRIFLYCLGVAALQTGAEVHGLVQMSNHWHGMVTDVCGRMPEFTQRFHRLVACCMNELFGRGENFWSTEQPNVVRLDHPDDVLDKMAYLMINPVRAGLVADPREWPGAITTGFCQTFVVRRPAVFFRKDGRMPEEVTLVTTLPPALREMGLAEASDRLRRLVRERVQREVNAVRAQGRKFLGVEGVRATSTSARPVTPEAKRRRRPLFASADPERRRAALARERAFRRAYYVALARWRAGDRAVRFPEGTYVMRVRHGAVCGPPPLPG